MLDWNGVRAALTFIEAPGDSICLQVNDAEDLQPLKDGVCKLLNRDDVAHLECTDKIIIPPDQTIHLEVCVYGQAGFTHNCPHFLIEHVSEVRGSHDVLVQIGAQAPQVQRSDPSSRIP